MDSNRPTRRSPNPTPVPTFRRDFPYVVLAGVTPQAFGRDPGAAPTFETVVADALPGTSAKHATADPMRRRRLLQADDSARIQFTLFSEAGDGRERLLEALADGTFAAAFDARKGEARSLVGASVDGKRSIEANGEEAPSKKKGSSKKSLAYDLTRGRRADYFSDESRRRRGRDVASPRRRAAAPPWAAKWIVRGDESRRRRG